MISYKKVGGLRFLRIGRFQASWCIRKAAPMGWDASQARAENAGLALMGLVALVAVVVAS